MILNIQYLRFLAAFTVIFAHANLSMYGISPSLTNLAAIGVDIFFVISGFIMPYIIFGGTHHQKERIKNDAVNFFAHRFIRVWPMYFVCTLIFIIISYLNANGFIKSPTTDLTFYFNDYRYKLDYIIQSLTFTNDIRGPILTAGWTLQFEFAFYSLMAVCISSGMRKFWHFFAALCVFIILAQAAHLIMKNNITSQLSRPFFIEFLLGMLVYYVYSARLLLSKHIAITLCIVSVALVFIFPLDLRIDSEIHRVMLWGGLSTAIVYSVLSLEPHTKKVPWLFFAGNASYSLYLTHGILAPIIAFVLVKNDALIIIGLPFYMLIYTASCLIVGFSFYYFVEAPLTSRLKKYFFKANKTETA